MKIEKVSVTFNALVTLIILIVVISAVVTILLYSYIAPKQPQVEIIKESNAAGTINVYVLPKEDKEIGNIYVRVVEKEGENQ